LAPSLRSKKQPLPPRVANIPQLKIVPSSAQHYGFKFLRSPKVKRRADRAKLSPLRRTPPSAAPPLTGGSRGHCGGAAGGESPSLS